MTIRTNSLNPKYIKVDREDKYKIIKIDIDSIAEIEGQHSEEEVSIDKIIEVDHVMLIIIEITLRRDNFRETKNYRDQKFRGGYRRNFRNNNFERGRSWSREKQYTGNL